MYNYDFKENNEQIILEKNAGVLEINNDIFNRCIVITNKNILLFNDASKNDPLNGRAVSLLNDYILNLRIPLANLNYKEEDNNTIINYNNMEIVLYDLLISKYIC